MSNDRRKHWCYKCQREAIGSDPGRRTGPPDRRVGERREQWSAFVSGNIYRHYKTNKVGLNKRKGDRRK